MIEVFDKNEFLTNINLLKFNYIPDPQINRSNVSEHLLEFQFNLIGKTMADTTVNENWKNDWKLNDIQKEIFKSYTLSILKKVFRFNSTKANSTYEFFNEKFGLSKLN